VAAGWADKFVVRVSDHLLEVKAANDAIWASQFCRHFPYSIPGHRGMRRTVWFQSHLCVARFLPAFKSMILRLVTGDGWVGKPKPVGTSGRKDTVTQEGLRRTVGETSPLRSKPLTERIACFPQLPCNHARL